MGKPRLTKAVFIAAVVCMVLSIKLIIAEFILCRISEMQDVSASNLMLAIIISAVCSFLLWELHYSLTHDSLGRKIKPSAEPVYKKTAQEYKPPKGRFVFDEDFFLKKMRNIADRFDLKLSYETSQSWDNDEILWYEAALTGKYNFELSFRDDMISITPVCFNDYNNYKYVYSYSFVFLDDAFVERKACEYEYSDQDLEYFEHIVFSSDILFCGLSNDEIFDIVEKIIEALYGAEKMNYETIKSDDGKESFIFYLDAPDYYGYTETTEIGNFKFILNKENGGN